MAFLLHVREKERESRWGFNCRRLEILADPWLGRILGDNVVFVLKVVDRFGFKFSFSSLDLEYKKETRENLVHYGK